MAFYVPLLKTNGDSEFLVMMKATSAPETDGSWANVGGAVFLNLASCATVTLWSAPHSSDIYCVTGDADGNYRFHLFDPGTDTWTVRSELIARPGDHANYTAAKAQPCVSVAVRSDGDVVVGLVGNNGTPNAYVFIRVRTSGVWGTLTELMVTALESLNSGVVAIGPDTSDRVTFVYKGSAADIETRSVGSTDVLGTETSVDVSPDNSRILAAPGVIDSSNKIYLPYIDLDNQISVADWISAAAPTVSLDSSIGDNTVLGQSAVSPPFITACLALDGTDVHLLYSNLDDSDIFHDSDVDGGGATDTEIQDAVTCNRISARVIGTNIDYVWLDGTTIKYNQESLGAAPAVFRHTLATMGVGY